MRRSLLREERWIVSALSIILLLALSFGMIQVTLGRFLMTSSLTDSAAAAEFDVLITAPAEFLTEQGEGVFEYRFLSAIDIRGFGFSVTNNGEVDVLCRPYITGGVFYRIYIDGKECAEFAVTAGEAVDFDLAIAPDGLDTNIRNAELFIDVQQLKGGYTV